MTVTDLDRRGKPGESVMRGGQSSDNPDHDVSVEGGNGGNGGNGRD